ncbi:acetoacetate decarboxylase family protein, partial [Ralstonia pseudosolanacearum]|uniref:acetoacetate decarboxylase family protein n=1 Tax=Ralstonia pseudosolanacearum TaxID=1310165 RepID=UPI001FFB9116
IGTSFPRCGNLEQDGSRFHSRTPLISVSLELAHHALAPVADLPVLEIVEARHLIADLTLGMGEVVFDYLAK